MDDESARDLAAILRTAQAAREQNAVRYLAESIFNALVGDAGARHGLEDPRAQELADIAIHLAGVFDARWKASRVG